MAKKQAVSASAEAHNALASAHAQPERALPHLRELGQEQAVLDQWLIETEGEETPEIAALWEQLQGEKTEKVERWGLYLLDRDTQQTLLEAEAAFYQAEAARLAARAKAFAANTARSRAQLLFQMQAQGIPEVKGTLVTVALQDNPHKVLGELSPERLAAMYLDEHLARFVAYTPEAFALDKKAVVEAFKVDAKSPLPELTVIREQRVVVK